MSQRSQWKIEKTQVSSREGIVATMCAQATEAGVEMLRKGGNAIDAAVAAGFTSGVAEPFNSGVGGISILVYHERHSGKTYVLDGTGTAPAAIRPDQFPLTSSAKPTGLYGWPEVANDANTTGYQSVCVPGMPACLCQAQAQFGRLSRAEVMAPAIHCAERGFLIDWYVALGMSSNQWRLLPYSESKRTFFRPDGSCYRTAMLGIEADLFTQPELARTLKEIANEGPDSFYKGRCAELIARDMEQHGGLISYDDLASYEIRYSEGGISGDYRGFQIIGGLENSGFPTVLHAMQLLEHDDIGSLGSGSVRELHLVAEAQRLAFLDRFTHLAHQDSVPIPLQGMLSKEYAMHRRNEILLHQAAVNAQAGDPWAFNDIQERPDFPAGATREGATTHLTVVDREGNMVSLLSTLGQVFGSAVVANQTGVLLNNGTMWFDPVPGRANSIAPKRRVLTAGTPVIVTRDGKPVISVGAPGGRRIISAVIHSLVNMIDHHMLPQEAVNTPRVHCEGRDTIVDIRVGERKLHALKELGHQVVVREETFSSSYFARPNAVMINPADGLYYGGVNQYKPAVAIGL